MRLSDSTTQRIRLVAGVLLLSLIATFLVSYEPQLRARVVDRDSIAYWAAGRLLIQHQDPYNPQSVLSLQRSQGYRQEKPLILRTPPWSLWMILPLGLFDAYWAWVLWLAILFASLLISMRISFRLYGNAAHPPPIFLIVGYLFAPIPACLVAGQLGIALLLGIVLFFLLEQRYPALAAASLLIPFAKPHLFSLLWPVLAVWIVTRKKWSMLGAFAAALLIAVAIALFYDAAVFAHYRDMVLQASIQHEFIPAFSGVVRLVFFRRFYWVQFLPMIVGLLWTAWYYWRNRHSWNWRDHGPALLVVSVLAAPYAWITDEAVLLPAVLQALLWIYRAKDKLTRRAQLVVFAFASLDVLLLLILRAKIPFSTGIYFWSSLVWTGWYWYGQRFRKQAAIGDSLKVASLVS